MEEISYVTKNIVKNIIGQYTDGKWIGSRAKYADYSDLYYYLPKKEQAQEWVAKTIIERGNNLGKGSTVTIIRSCLRG